MTYHRNILFFIILSLFSYSQIIAQNSLLRGKITDLKTKKVLIAASVAIKGTTIGCFSNEDGFFELVVPKKNINDSIIFSYIGYKNQLFLVTELLKSKENNILLQANNIELDEIIVKKKKDKIPTALEILEKSIKNIAKNYIQYPYNQIFFYREYLLEKDTCKKLTHANLQIYDSKAYKIQQHDYTKPLKNGVNFRLVSLEYSQDFSKFSKINGLVNTNFLEQRNWIRNRNFLFDEKKVQEFVLSLSLFTMHEDAYVYEIDFSIDEIGKYKNLKGKVWVSETDFGIFKIQFDYDLAFTPFNEQLQESYEIYHQVKETILFSKKDNLYFVNYQSLDTKLSYQDLKTQEDLQEESHFEIFSQEVATKNVVAFESTLSIPITDNSPDFDKIIFIPNTERDKKWFELLNKTKK